MAEEVRSAALPAAAERPFVGREHELAQFVGFVPGQRQVLELVGISGIGKTALLRRFAAVAREREWLLATVDAAAADSVDRLLATFRHGLGVGPGPRVVKRSFAEFDQALEEQLAVDAVLARSGGAEAIFDAVGQLRDPIGLAPIVAQVAGALNDRVRDKLRSRVALEVHLRGAETRLTGAFCEAIVELSDRTDRPVVLMVDTYEHARQLDAWVCGSLVETLPPSARLVLSGRNHLRRMNVDWTEHVDRIHPLTVRELEQPDAITLLGRFGLTNREQARSLAEATGGWPLLLVLARQLAVDAGGWERIGALELPRDRDELANTLLEAIMREERAQPLRDLLERGAVAPWLDPPLIAALLEVDRATAQDLYDRLAVHTFAERDPHGLRLHERLAEMLHERLRYRDPDELARVRARLDAHFRDRAERSSGDTPA